MLHRGLNYEGLEGIARNADADRGRNQGLLISRFCALYPGDFLSLLPENLYRRATPCSILSTFSALEQG
jgi:hypothetical protein